MMAAEFAPSARGWENICHNGRIYRPQKNLAGGHMRRRCAKADLDFKCIGYAATDGKGQGYAIIRFGENEHHCEPCASTNDVATIRRDVINTAGGRAGVPPMRALAECLEGATDAALQLLPPSGSLKRCAKNAAHRAAKRLGVEGAAGFVANYSSLENLAIPPHLLRRRDGAEFLLYDSGAGPDRILLLGTQANVEMLQSAAVWAADGTFKVCPKLWAQLYTVRALVGGYCLPCVYALIPGKSQEVYTTMWEQIRVLAGEGRAPRD